MRQLLPLTFVIFEYRLRWSIQLVKKRQKTRVKIPFLMKHYEKHNCLIGEELF